VQKVRAVAHRLVDLARIAMPVSGKRLVLMCMRIAPGWRCKSIATSSAASWR
jgi:hypothetical protein